MIKIVRIITTVATVVTVALQFSAVASNYEDYIDRYWELAVEHQREYGIPASITLAQGLLESAAGKSTLASEGNNHFGIKCHKEWKGKTMLRNDDKADDCFRVYDTPEESFRDHSLFLRRTRYQKLFDLDITDYQGWARGLKECGYATDPQYAARLITIIERYSLYTYDTDSDNLTEETVAFIREHLAKTHPIRKSRGLHYVVAMPGDTYSSIAKELGMDKKKLMGYNDVDKDREIKAWEEVYLVEKKEEAPEGVSKATIGDGESMHSISQRYGIKLSILKDLNKKAKDKPGVTLRLR